MPGACPRKDGGERMKPVVVVGTVFVDVKAFSNSPLDPDGRNLGRVQFVQGGVGRNVAETMALLGGQVRFASSVTAGGLGEEVLVRLHALGVDTTAVGKAAEAGMGMWVAILRPDGNLALSLSQMPDLTMMKAAWRSAGPELLAGAGLCVLELDLDAEMAELVLQAASAAGVPVIGLPGNFSVVRARPDLLQQLDTFILNQHEAGLLLGAPVPQDADAALASARVICAGDTRLRNAVVTLGAAGAVAAGQRGEARVTALRAEVRDTTGAGDAFVAGFSHAVNAGAGLTGALACAARVAGWTVNSAESVCRDLPARIAADDWAGWTKLGPGTV